MDIAVLDERGILREVRTVSAADDRTDAVRRTVALPAGHDMGQRLGQYRWDGLRECFLPVVAEPLAAAGREAPGLVEVLVSIADALHDKGIIAMTTEQRAVLADWRAART